MPDSHSCPPADNGSALTGIRVVDLSRILAGPTCTQILGDLGADVIKIERPGAGDDTRRWGPPYVESPDGTAGTESAYYLAANRNKRSVCLDFTNADEREGLLELIDHADVLVENFRTGTLSRYSLGYEQLSARNPRLIYCSVTGFGQTGPYAERPGYDFLAQAMGGIMSITGEPDGRPMKVGVGISDVTTGLYATIGVLAALRHRSATGRGQHIDVCLLDSQVSWLVNEATNFFVSGEVPRRLGNEHPNIVPYGVYESADGFVVVTVGNDEQFRSWCDVVGAPELASDDRFSTNPARVTNREEFESEAAVLMRRRGTAEWLELLEAARVPCGPVNDIGQVFDDPQVVERGMRIEMKYPHARSGAISLIGSPLKMSDSPISYRLPPPILGEHTEEVLRDCRHTPREAI